MTGIPWPPSGSSSPVIRTDFVHDAAWAEVRAAMVEPQTTAGFLPVIDVIDDRSHDGLTVADLLAAGPAPPEQRVAFLVDADTLTRPDRPVLVVNLQPGAGPLHGTTFRVIPSEMWGVQNNLWQCNMDWNDFADAVDADGVFRGFGPPTGAG